MDVLAFHSYHDSWELGLEITELALSVARRTSRSTNSETGCIARANAYDQTIEMAARNDIGYAVWELVISDCADCADTRRWKHGLLYIDGTTRDPAAIAAVQGIYLNRGDSLAAPPAVPKTDVEHKPANLAAAVKSWLVSHPQQQAVEDEPMCRQDQNAVLNQTNIHGGKDGSHPYRAIDLESGTPAMACAALCCNWTGCAAWVVQSGTAASKKDQGCTAKTKTCWLKPDAKGVRTADLHSTSGVVTAVPARSFGPPGPAPSPPKASYFAGLALLDAIANLLESAGLSSATVPLSGVVRNLQRLGPTNASLAEHKTVLASQAAPGGTAACDS